MDNEFDFLKTETTAGFTINIDTDGYYAEGANGTLVEVAKMPEVEDARYLLAYKYNQDDKSLVLDVDKLEEIKEEIEKEKKEAIPTVVERLDALESAILEMVLGGD